MKEWRKNLLAAETAAQKQTSVPCPLLEFPCLKNETFLEEPAVHACYSLFKLEQSEDPLQMENSHGVGRGFE